MSATGLLWSLALGLWCVQHASTYEFHFKHANSTGIKNLTEFCKASDCVAKCCPENEIMLNNFFDDSEKNNQTCVKSSVLMAKYGVKNPDNYSDIVVYNKDIQRKVRKTDKNANEFKFIYDSNFVVSKLSNTTYLGSFESATRYKTYLLEDGKWVLRRVNYLYQFTVFEPLRFCIEHEVYLYDSGEELVSTNASVVVWVVSDVFEAPASNRRVISSAYGLLVSCVFLLLTLAVYAVLPELRNLAGMILMACMTTYFAFFLIRVIHVFSNESKILSPAGCTALTIIFYYLMLATFCWMNVLSFDIWWSFRGFRKLRHGVMSKFGCYCVYAWGVPLVPTLFVIIVDQLDLTHLPNFVQPHVFGSMCFFEPETGLLYVSLPILILICVNVLLFLMTTFNIWKIKRNSMGFVRRTNEVSRFWVMGLKLSLVMGVSWILEVIGNLVNTESPVWIISDLYNSLVGVFIFLIFVCKKKIFLRLCSRFSIDNALVQYVRSRDDAATKINSHTDTNDIRL